MASIFETNYDTAPFSVIKDKDYKSLIEKAIQEALMEIKSITENKDLPTFKNTIEALAFSGEKLDRLSSMFFNLHNAETNETIQEQVQQISPLLSDFQNDIFLNENLFQRIKIIYEQYSPKNEEEKMLLEKTYKQFVCNGANLSEVDKQELRKIDKELALKTLNFAQNVLAETNHFELIISDEKDIDGLPDFAKQPAKQLALSREKQGYLFTLDYPSYVPFVTYVHNRELRKKMFLANASKCFLSEKNNNKQNVLDIINLRQRRAVLLGFISHADFVLQERMAQNPTMVQEFLKELLNKAKPAAQLELKELQQFAQRKDGITDFQKWDTAYYSEKLKEERFALNDELLKPYFQLENVLKGIFTISEKLYNIHFEEIKNIDIYHQDVKTFKVTDDKGEFMAILYTDFHPRKGKRNGAWMTSYKNQYFSDGQNSRPHISIVCNFTPPTENIPSLLTFNEVTTLFHEFGHALHGMLANTKYPTLSGTNVYWDFVELPSQIMENWCYEKEALELFAHHYQTGELLPMEYIEKIKDSAAFMEGLQTLRQLSFGLLDMAWHTNPDIKEISQIKKIEDEITQPTDLYPHITDSCVSTSFSHIFSGGYSSGYYSYKWAEVLDADAFELFLEKGIFDKATANSFKENILSKGGSEPPMDLYIRFRGKKPSVDALLRRSGLVK